jgi:hypothetical protein
MILPAIAVLELSFCADWSILDKQVTLFSLFLDVGSIYKVFDLKNYSFLYQISDDNVQEIKIRFTSIYFFPLMHLIGLKI